jgi:uncharacterized protein (DUF2141 family)
MNLIISFLILISSFNASPPDGKLSIHITNINLIEGNLYIAIYDNEHDFMKIEKAVFRKVHPIRKAEELVVIENVPAGNYAVSVFQDINGNASLDTRKWGIPLEPFGFSNDARGKTGPPKFKNAQFSFPENQEISIKLVNNAKK